MLKFLTSLSFLYGFILLLMIGYGMLYYRSFTRNGYQRRLFPFIFSLISIACLGFLYFNIHAPLRLQTFSNVDHHFIRHDGFVVTKQVELGRTDTLHHPDASFNRFRLSKKNDLLLVNSDYSEEPFYVKVGNDTRIASASFPVAAHVISFRCDSARVRVTGNPDQSITLQVNNTMIAASKMQIRKGLSAWDMLRNDTAFINTAEHRNEKIIQSLKNILLLRNEQEMRFFISGRLFHSGVDLRFDEKPLQEKDLAFSTAINDNSMVGWGIGFPEKNKNQFHIRLMANDSFELACRYPVSYPMSEEPPKNTKREWTSHSIRKFIVSDPLHLQQLPVHFTEGFLFAAFPGDSTLDFNPVLLNYRKGGSNADLDLQVKSIAAGVKMPQVSTGEIMLPARSGDFSWKFSIVNSFNWQLGTATVSSGNWQILLFGSLLFFFLLVFFTSWLKPPNQLSWVWQLLACVLMVMLTTRFFLYWRYKSFPPYEGLDLPSVQQLNSPWNFGIIVLTTLVLAFIFGFDGLKYLYYQVRLKAGALFKRPFSRPIARNEDMESRVGVLINRVPFVRNLSAKTIFFSSWILLLMASGAFAALRNFDTAVSRHLAIVLVLLYFAYVYIACKYSPLVAPSGKSWWNINTSNAIQLVISNPVKVLLSVSLLGLFLFIDIGFALIFFNFLLFNEAFIFINYGIAGLSAGRRQNASLFGALGIVYLVLFSFNLVYGPYLFKYLLELDAVFYMAGYMVFALLVVYSVDRLLRISGRKKYFIRFFATIAVAALSFIVFPKERIQEKAAITKYRIDVLTTPTDKVVEKAYADGDSYEPVIRAAQNQWFINSFIYEENNPQVNKAGFHLLPHAPQNRGAKYNAQATDLVTSRFLVAEHGRWSVLLYVLLLFVPMALLAYFYKLYPDFTNRINTGYPTIMTGFSLLNYLLITALLVILAATGRYIFFGQDLPFGSILSKQSVLFPAAILVLVVFLFRKIPLQQYPNRGKLAPGILVFTGLVVLLFFVKPVFNREKEFGVTDLSKNMNAYIQAHIQPLFDEIDTAAPTRRLPVAQKDRLFVQQLKELLRNGSLNDASPFLTKQLQLYCQADFSGHLDPNRMLFLDLHAGSPELAVNPNFFHAEPPPHLREVWTGNIYGDSSNYNLSLWNATNWKVVNSRITGYEGPKDVELTAGVQVTWSNNDQQTGRLYLVNNSGKLLGIKSTDQIIQLQPKDSFLLRNPDKLYLTGSPGEDEHVLLVQPDAFMKNYYVNGNRFYLYPLGNDLVWARNFAESISSEQVAGSKSGNDVFISMDAVLTDSLSESIKQMLYLDTAYKKGSEYAVCIAAGDGRLLAMPDHIKGIRRPDPNDKPAFHRAIRGDGGWVRPSELRRKAGNINLLRMNPGPGSTLKPIIFSAIASQLPLHWDAFAAEGFSEKQQFFGGEKVPDYDFEKNNGRISSVADYIRYSDNYYHANLLLLGSYSRQGLQNMLSEYFTRQNPVNGLHWPYFSYNGQQYWLNGFENWPGYTAGKANFGSDSSFISVGLFNNYGIHTYRNGKNVDRFASAYDTLLFGEAWKRSGFILPEYALFDQKGTGMDMSRPNEVFLSSFRGHVKGSSQVMVPPVKMLDAYGKLLSQNRNFSLTLDPYPTARKFVPFYVDNGVAYSNYLSLMRESIFKGMHDALFSGTAARLGSMLKNASPYYYYAKTGTTGDDELKAKSKLLTIVISKKDIADPGFNFRNNKFIVIYFTSQNGPAKQNEEFQADVIRIVEGSAVFKRYMETKDQ